MTMSIRALAAAACAALSVTLGAPRARAQAMTLTPEQQSLHEIYKELIETNTEDSAGVGSVTKASEQIAARFRAAGYPESDIHLLGPTEDKHAVIVRLHGTGAKKPLLLLAHLDVVMALPTDWTSDPFKLVEKDGYYYGRGSIDDKAMASIFVANMIRYKKEGFVPDRDIILALTPDEEKSGLFGTEWLIEHHKDLIDAAYALNEGGGGSLKNGKPFLHAVQATEKAFTNFTLTVKNPGGHSSVPRPDNAIYQLAEGLVRFRRFSFPVQLNDVTRAFFTGTAAIETPERAAAMRALLKNPSDAAAAATLSRDPRYNSILRTTCVATRLSGGHADNALPQTATALVNCRVFPNVPIDSVRATIIRVLNDTGIVVSPSEQLGPTSPSPLSPELMDPIKTLTARMFDNVPVIPFMSTGATDGRYLRAAGIPTYGVSGLFLDPGDIRAHGRDERVPQKSLYESQAFLYELVKMLSTEKPKA
ncbi:MAG: M20/M25/M40 family metallo-hydrolase [Gemmatimonadaceae bacterium]|nr:M20/M25/M40 family metallo-hydrolase [Gemmatimonadaceae bacterium]